MPLSTHIFIFESELSEKPDEMPEGNQDRLESYLEGLQLQLDGLLGLSTNWAKNWRSHGHQWRVKTDQSHSKLRFERPMCDYATEFRKVAM